jgi:hypothetical protein
MKLRIKYNVGKWIMWGYGGRVLYPFVLFRDDKVTDKLFRHELEHVYQIRREGFIRFHLFYIWYLIRHGYKNNPYEIEARATESKRLTAKERQLKLRRTE